MACGEVFRSEEAALGPRRLKGRLARMAREAGLFRRAWAGVLVADSFASRGVACGAVSARGKRAGKIGSPVQVGVTGRESSREWLRCGGGASREYADGELLSDAR
jgi:hypothetical protein